MATQRARKPRARAPRTASPATLDPAIESLHLEETARRAAYLLKAAHPSVRFTSGRRDKVDQARAMAANVVLNRRWIEQTYRASPLRARLQAWIDEHPEAASKAAIQAGLLAIFDALPPAQLAVFSRHLGGTAFDVQPVDDARGGDAIKQTIRALPRLKLFLEEEGGLVRWHVEL